MQAILADLDAIARFFQEVDDRGQVTRTEGAIEVALPDNVGLLVVEWPAGGPVQVRLPLFPVPPPRVGAVLELVADANSSLPMLGFMLDRATGWLEFKTTVFPDEHGGVPATTLGRVVVTAQEAVSQHGGTLEDACNLDPPVPPSWWSDE